ncbi:hypothetical protein [Pseudomonas sp. KK4]|uniref:hypothetical protein n=1 Tax=Pseudomonas sp. KK4 TaxID=1855729 RepID=UPI00111557EC|nr:hypothetical protein [Pseudomonas sp. KK4]
MDRFTVVPKWVIFPEIHVEANSSYDNSKPIGEGSFDIGCTFNVDSEDSTLHASVFIKNESHEELNLEYKFDLHIYSVFEISDDYNALPVKAKERVVIDIAELLIGSLREMVITLTSRGPWGAYILPFLDVKKLSKDLIGSYELKD